MKTVKMAELPKCNGCRAENSAVYDVPSSSGPWGHFCEDCARKYSTPALMTIGYRLVTD